MSSSTPRRWGSAVRYRLTVLASAAALSVLGLTAVTGPAHADPNIQITDSADPVPAGTSYNYIVTIPDPTFEGGFAFASIDLSGAAATFTGITSDNGTLSCSTAGTHAQCNTTGNPGTAPIHITATVLPTAAGTVTADTVLEGMGPIASDSTTTTITEEPAVAADLAVTVADSADPVALGDGYTYSTTVTNNGPDPATGVTAATTLSGAARTIVTATSSQGSCIITAPTVNCALGGLAASASATVTITIEPAATGTLTATATVTGNEDDPTSGNDTDAENTTINNGHGCSITGTAGNDTLNGTSGADVICGLGGNDTINGGNGSDTVHAGTGNDTANGGNSDDTLYSGSGDDVMGGGNGNDTINVQDGAGGDTADGGLGTDTCTVDVGDTTISC